MFAYCCNNPVHQRDISGTSSDSGLDLIDYLIIHTLVQVFVATEYGLYPEVYVKGPLGRGFLDLYDKENHSYYEVTSQRNSTNIYKKIQILKYDAANMMGRPVYNQLRDIPKLQKGTEKIDGHFMYGNYLIHYWSKTAGLIVYDSKKVNQYQEQPELSLSPHQSLVPATSSSRQLAGCIGFAIMWGIGMGAMLGMADRVQMAR